MMKYTKIFNDHSGTSHFADEEVALKSAGEIGCLSSLLPADGMVFRETSDTYDYDWHPTPRRQWIILLDGEIEIETGDGETRRFHGGDILRMEDIDHRGHRTRQLSTGPRRSIFIPF